MAELAAIAGFTGKEFCMFKRGKKVLEVNRLFLLLHKEAVFQKRKPYQNLPLSSDFSLILIPI